MGLSGLLYIFAAAGLLLLSYCVEFTVDGVGDEVLVLSYCVKFTVGGGGDGGFGVVLLWQIHC
jgi:hypothetical protein